MCLGHESVGDIVAVGANVSAHYPALVVGARAAIEPGLNCTSCEYCLSGRYNLCATLRFASSAKTKPHLDGTLQRYFTWPARLCHVLPPTLSLFSAALIEPLAVVLQALSRSKLEPGQSVLVVGAGAVGLLACAAAKAFGASLVAAIDIDEDRLAFAKRNGWVDATYCTRPTPNNGASAQPTHNGAAGAPPQPSSNGASASPAPAATRQEQDAQTVAASKRQAADILDAVRSTSSHAEMAAGSGFDVVYECTGVPVCINTSVFAAKTGGRVALIGMGHPIVTMPLGAAALREVDVLGVFRYANMFPKAIRLLSSGALPSHPIDLSASNQAPSKMGSIEALVSHTYPLAQALQAFQTLRAGRSPDGKKVVKVFVVDQEDEGSDALPL